MAFFPIVAVAWLVRAGRVWRTRRQPWRSCFFRSRLCRNPRPFWGNSQRRPFIMAIPQEISGDRAKTGDSRRALGKNIWETVYYGDHAFFRWRSCQTRRLAIPGLGKTFWKPFIMASFPSKSDDHAKIRDLRLVIWEKYFGNRLSWRSRNQARSDKRNLSDWQNPSDW